MKYVFSTFVYLPIMGGIQVYIHQIAQHLVRQGHEVCVITSQKNIPDIVTEDFEGEKVIRIPAYEIGGFWFLKQKKRAMQLIEKEISDADVVHVNAPKLLYRYFAEKKQKYGYRLIATSHGWFYHTKKFKAVKDWYFRNIIVKYAPYYDGIINVSYQDRDIAESFGLKGTHVVENGVDINKYAGLPEKESFDYRFIYFGRIAPNKGILECLKKLDGYRKDYTFDVIGNCSDTKYKEKLTEFTDSHNMKSRVSFLGRLPEEEIRERLSQADIILMPSLHEGFGMALAECLLSGRPIIANNNDAFRRIMQSVKCENSLFDFESEKSDFGAKVEELRRSAKKPQNAEQYSEENMISKTLEIYGV